MRNLCIFHLTNSVTMRRKLCCRHSRQTSYVRLENVCCHFWGKRGEGGIIESVDGLSKILFSMFCHISIKIWFKMKRDRRERK